ncbi:MAG: three-Cys-motif partner protein TcmP [Pseudomonadota bacterium]|nr:three-Cys-motif partner protein TcmP [Pseudomonadota bacterium]
MPAPREWGFWTVGKLDMLGQYPSAFTTAAKYKARGVTTYLDLFAGQGDNVSKETGEKVENSPEIALAADPPFSHLRFFERDNAESLRQLLDGRFAGRDCGIVEGDSNKTLGSELNKGDLERWAPTFAFIDPNGPDCWWATLERLAAFKKGSKYKTEQWMLFSVDMFIRFLRTDGGEVRPVDAERITRMYGSDEWRAIYTARRGDELEAPEARAEYVNLMRWRLEHILGYGWTHSFDIRTHKRSIYSMIFATDNPAGNTIMGDIYTRAADRFPEMQREARDRMRGQDALFDHPATGPAYTHVSPLPPYGSVERDGPAKSG